MTDEELQLLETIVKLFEKETMFSSRIEIDHPYYRTVVAWGQQRPKDIIPWLLHHINDNWHWCHALEEIVGKANAPQIPMEYAGRGDKITEFWLSWGRARLYV